MQKLIKNGLTKNPLKSHLQTDLPKTHTSIWKTKLYFSQNVLLYYLSAFFVIGDPPVPDCHWGSRPVQRYQFRTVVLVWSHLYTDALLLPPGVIFIDFHPCREGTFWYPFPIWNFLVILSWTKRRGRGLLLMIAS